MGKITFIEHDNTEHVTEFEAGATLMQIAADNAIPGVDGDCGGECACGTCHCYIDPAQWDLLPAAEKDESDMLDFVAAERRPTSRLACQVKVTAAMEGLRVEVPGRQI